jgi:hypothetical protein
MSGRSRPAALTGVQAAFCLKITKKMAKYTIARFFREPVDPERDQADDYFERIKRPMDLGTILQNLQEERYPSVDRWRDDMNLIWRNAMSYNAPGSPLHAIARDLSEIFRQRSEAVPSTQSEEWLLAMREGHQKLMRILGARPEGVSSPSVVAVAPKPAPPAKAATKIILRTQR